jgi:serine/threonine protein kinase
MAERIGRYEIEKRLGAGGMAVVYKALDPRIGRTIAIKTIKVDSSLGFEREELRQRLYREAQAAGKLNHPNIVTIYDIGEEGETDYIAMEFIEGESLNEWMAKNPKPPVQQTVAIIEQIASGLEYAAANGIIHRDIKPANILLTQTLTAKIADFGIAKIASTQLTQTGSVLGSPFYMSPEQAMGNDLDGRSDIFSLGIIFYEMLTGEKPFSGTNPTTIIYKILHEEPVAPQQLNVILHPAFNEIVGRMLAKDPDKRYQSCSQLMQDLKNYASMTVREEKPQIPPPEYTQKTEAKSGARGRVIALALLLAAVIVSIAGYYLFWKPRKSVVQDTAQTQATPRTPALAENKTASVGSPAGSVPTAAKEKSNQTVPAKQPAANDRIVDQSAQKAVSATAQNADLASSPKNAPVKESVGTEMKATQMEKQAFGHAELRLEFAGASYPVTIYEGVVPIKELSASNPSIQIAAGTHRFRLVSEDGFIDQKLNQVNLKADEVYTISVPAICSAFIDLPNDAYDGCTIQLDGKTIAAPYPAQIPKLAAGIHKVVFRWNSGKYVGKEIISSFPGEANHHYRIHGEPAGEKVVVQQIR